MKPAFIKFHNSASASISPLPVWYDSFDDEYDNQLGHYYKEGIFKSIQHVDRDEDGMNSTLLKKLLLLIRTEVAQEK